MSNYPVEKFTFESTYPIVINARDNQCLYFEIDNRTVAVDDEYGLEYIFDIGGFPTTYFDCTSLDQKCKINKIQKSLSLHALNEAISFLKTVFDGPQALPIEELDGIQIVKAIHSHRPGGWVQLVQDCLKD